MRKKRCREREPHIVSRAQACLCVASTLVFIDCADQYKSTTRLAGCRWVPRGSNRWYSLACWGPPVVATPPHDLSRLRSSCTVYATVCVAFDVYVRVMIEPRCTKEFNL